jgi:hypothetical protein
VIERAAIELAPIKQFANVVEGNTCHPGCLGVVGRWSLPGRPLDLVEVDAGIADADIGDPTGRRCSGAYEHPQCGLVRPGSGAAPASPAGDR